MTIRTVALRVLVPAGALFLGITAWENFHHSSGSGSLHESTPKVASALKLEASVSRARRGTRSFAAYELYVRGQDPVLLRSDSAAKTGLDYFARAIEADPNFAAAYAGLAEMYARQSMANRPALPDSELKKRAESAARKAIALDDSLAEGHAALGLVDSYWLVDLNAAEQELERAIALDPSVGRARDYLALNRALMGRTAEAIEDARTGVTADPLSPTARIALAQVLYLTDKCNEAFPILDSLSLMNPPPLRVAITRSLCFEAQHRWADAEAAVHEPAASGGIHAMGLLGLALAQNGKRKDALEIRSKLMTIARTNTNAYFDAAIVSYGLGDIDDALANFDRASMSAGSAYEVQGPAFAALKHDRRFRTVMGQHGIRIASR